MNIKDVDIKKMKIDDDFLVKWIKKDVLTGRHFFYVKIDKRNLNENFQNSESEMIKHYSQVFVPFISRYAFLSFDENVAQQLKMRLIDVKFIKETYEEAENTSWLIYEFMFIYVKEDDNGKKMCLSNASFLDCIKCDYAPSLSFEKVKDEIPALSDMKVGEVRALGKEMLEKVVKIVKDENMDENGKTADEN